MAKILLDYVFPISVVASVPAASTAYLKQVVVVAKPKTGQEANVGNLYECSTMTAVAARTDNTNAQQLFNAGMSKVYVLLANGLNVVDYVDAILGQAFTVLISDDFDDADIVDAAASLVKDDLTFTAKNTGYAGNLISVEFLDTGTAGAEVVTVTDKKISVSMEGGVSTATQLKTAIDASSAAMALIDAVTVAAGQGASAQAAFAEDFLENGTGLEVGTFDGVVGFSSADTDVCQAFGANENRCGFYGDSTNKAKNMFYAFGKLLSNSSNWTNQQYISMPYDDGVDTLGEANSLFDDKVSFVLNDTELGNRLALFAVGGKAIVAPYIGKNLRVDLQSAALSWIAANQPAYTLTNAALLEGRLQDDVIQKKYIDPPLKWITAGTIAVKLIEDNFVASGFIDIAEPKALWRLVGEMRSTL